MLYDESGKCLQTNKLSSFESLSETQKGEVFNHIRSLIQGALSYSPDFCISRVCGGKFSNWAHTPLDYIYQYHKNRNVLSPENEAGKDVGRLFKYVMVNDKYRNYQMISDTNDYHPVNHYKLYEK